MGRLVSVAALVLATGSIHAVAASPTPTPPAAAAPAAAAFSKKPRRVQPRAAVPEEVLALLPWKGIYASGEGMSAPAWRVVVTLEGDLRAGSNPRPGSSATAVLDKKRTKLAPDVLAALIALADRAWREKPARRGPPNPEYAELLVVADGPDVFYIEGQGPITGGIAEQLLRRLKAEAAAK